MSTNYRRMDPDELAALRAAAMHAIMGPLRWRRHGIGLLQAYLFEADHVSKPEVRIHIWHPSARRQGIADHGDIHNHRFDFDSAVLVGNIRHLVYEPAKGDDWGAFEVVNARKDVGARYELTKGETFGLTGGTGHCFIAGERYTFERGAFHKSITEGLCVTVITKRNQRRDKALVLSKLDRPPVHAFEADDDFDMMPILEEAINALAEGLSQ